MYFNENRCRYEAISSTGTNRTMLVAAFRNRFLKGPKYGFQ